MQDICYRAIIKSSTILCLQWQMKQFNTTQKMEENEYNVLLLDATKAFDKVSFKVLFDLLLDKNVCPKIV